MHIQEAQEAKFQLEKTIKEAIENYESAYVGATITNLGIIRHRAICVDEEVYTEIEIFITAEIK